MVFTVCAVDLGGTSLVLNRAWRGEPEHVLGGKHLATSGPQLICVCFQELTPSVEVGETSCFRLAWFLSDAATELTQVCSGRPLGVHTGP